MAVPKPERGLVIRYDFLFQSDRKGGLESGKDRPCAILLISEPQADELQRVYLCSITHGAPVNRQDGVEIPYKVCRHLGLDDERMWIEVNELNRFIWDKARVPFGLVPIKKYTWAYGFLPPSLYRQMRDGVVRHSQAGKLSVVERED